MKNRLNLSNLPVLFLLICCMLLSSPSFALAEENMKTVRVGVYDMAGFCEHDPLGNLSGYNIDYLNKIAGITGWNYEYVEVGNFHNGLIKLQHKQIDLLAPCQITPERQEKYDFGSYSFGTEYVALITSPDNNACSFQDYDSFNGLTVGVVSDYLITDYFLEYAEKNDFQVELKYYDSPNKALAAVHKGETDAAIANLMNVTANDKVLARFSPEPFYYITWKGNTALLEELDNAMIELASNYPSLENELQEKFFPVYKEQYFSKEDLSYIKSLDVINLGYTKELAPVSFTDSSTGEFKGMAREIFNRIEDLSGLKFNYIPLPQGRVDIEYLKLHDICLISGVEQNSVNMNTIGMKLSSPYLTMQKVVIARDDFKVTANSTAPITIALNPEYKNMNYIIKYNNPNLTILDFADNKECFDAIKSGRADIMLQNQYVADIYLSKPFYDELDIFPLQGLENNHCLGIISNDAGNAGHPDCSRLLMILNKAISQISDDEVKNIIANESLECKYNYTIGDFIYKYHVVLIPLAALILTALVLLLYIAWLRNHNLKISQAEEAKLQSIANNIGGGVLVLTPDSSLRITYVNEGLLSILGYDKSEEQNMIGVNYRNFVHEEDAKKLQALSGMAAGEQNKISMQLCIQTKHEAYIQTLFCGTLTHSATGQAELYCVIMDLSEQIAIQEKLALQQRRHEFLLEKSDDIIYEIDISTGQISSSEKMMQKFGWHLDSLIPSIDVKKLMPLWHIHKMDSDKLHAFIQNTLQVKTSSECILRISAPEDAFLWCKIISHPILDHNNEVTSVIGLIADINQEMQEKQMLEKQSRTDGPTGLLNKKTFLDETARYLKKYPSKESALLFIDLDYFKCINDTLGHITGDLAILDAAKKIQKLFAECDLISRFGGDEFCIFIPEISRPDLTGKLTAAVKKLAETYSDSGASVSITASVGAVYNISGLCSQNQLLELADQALYISKENGRNRFTLRDI